MKKTVLEITFRVVKVFFPIAVYVVRKSPRLQNLAVRALGDSPLFRQAQAAVGARAVSGYSSTLALRGHLLWVDAIRNKLIPEVTVVIPIHNAYRATVQCLRSIESTVGRDIKILLINDFSTDPKILDLLRIYEKKPNFRIENNTENLGYTKTVNKAFELTGTDDVVLLNSDTRVTGLWLQALQYAAYSSLRVATVTAISDNSGAFSVTPSPLEPRSQEHAEHFSKIICQATQGRLLDVPTGNGFCMYIRRAALNEIGYYDDIKYPRGYGEENDFAMRCSRAGWTSLVSDKSFVFHMTSQSFGAEKAPLLRSGLRQLSMDYPEYNLMTQRFNDQEFQEIRSKVKLSLQVQVEPKRRVLYIMPIVGGGLPATNADVRKSLAEDTESYVLVCRGKEISLYLSSLENLGEPIETYELESPVNVFSHRSLEYDRVCADIVYRYSIEVVHFEHMAWQSLGAAEIVRKLGVRTVFTIHDFYCICASHNLLDETGKYCGGVCTPKDGSCQIDIWPNNGTPSFKHKFIFRWRENFQDFLNHCDVLIAPSKSAKQVVIDNYPGKFQGKFLVLPHSRNFDSVKEPRRDLEIHGKLKVLVPGNIGMSKGALLIEKIARLDKNNDLEFHFLGETWQNLKAVGVHHGPYTRELFLDSFVKTDAHIAAILSIWPETFCHTLTESWLAGLPVLGLDIGAVGERIRESGAGWLVNASSTPEEILEVLIRLKSEPQKIHEINAALESWQKKSLKRNFSNTMRDDYYDAYFK